jgi:hypothetical protein
MHRGIPNHPEHEMKTYAFMRAIGFLAVILAFGCLKPESTGPGTDSGQTPIGDDNRLASATSSTNWPPEDEGTQPIQVFGTADSVLSLSFMQALDTGREPVPVRRAATILVYRSGYNPVFDSVPTLRFDFPASDTCKIKPEDLNPLIPMDMDTLRFSVEVRTDTARGLFPGFTYSKKERKFLKSPYPFNTPGTNNLISPHYDFAGIPDSGFKSFQSDTSGNAKFYYYIPGSPYFWLQSLRNDSLYIGPTIYGRFPLRCVKVVSQSEPKAVFTIDVYALSLAKEMVNDSLHHSEPTDVFRLGERILHTQGEGNPPIRSR